MPTKINAKRIKYTLNLGSNDKATATSSTLSLPQKKKPPNDL